LPLSVSGRTRIAPRAVHEPRADRSKHRDHQQQGQLEQSDREGRILDWFALKAESFARFFGTPTFLIAQTVIVLGWMAVNILGWTKFDIYPFILLNLAFSLQAAYAAPLILLAQTRQADRDKAHSDADARHREDLAKASEQRQLLAANQTELLLGLLQQNTELTEMTKQMSERIEALTLELNNKLAKPWTGTQV
jgi:uncharacterized membrane protein